MRTLFIVLSVTLFLAIAPCQAPAAQPKKSEFKAGLAVRVITPSEPMWMAGYASRTQPAKEKTQDLFIKALAMQDGHGKKLVLVTSDLIGLPRSMTDVVAAQVKRQTGLSQNCLMLTASHTHSGPVIQDSLLDMYEMPAELANKVAPYTKQIQKWMIDTIVAALKDLRPARLAVGMGRAGFAVNRRLNTEKGWTNFANPKGPVDHDVPVLRVQTPQGKLRAAVFGYACHNTTMQFYKWCGDYAGYAQAEIEKKHPGAIALFWIGCGGDANPLPRSKLELCVKYGKELAKAVEKVLASDMTLIQGSLAARYEKIAIPFDKLPSKAQFAADVLSKNSALRKRSSRYLKILELGKKIDDHYRHYPIQVWRLGGQALWVALGGEVVIDYNLRIKKELGGTIPLWITGYANDVMAYIPSLRVLKEGGYEGESSMIYYGMPTKWGPAIEEKIMAKVHDLAKKVKSK